MTNSPYAPPKAELFPPLTTQDRAPLPDMASLNNGDLREILSNPDTYTADAVHSAARELSARHAIPRYTTHIYSTRLRTHFAVRRNIHIDLFTKLRILFSESNLRKYSLMISIIQSVILIHQVFNLVKILKAMTIELLNNEYYLVLSYGISITSSILMVIFFFTLYKTLCARSIDSN